MPEGRRPLKAEKRRQILLILAVCLLLAGLLFWQQLLLASPLFFGYRGPDMFGIYTADLDGKNFHPLLLDARREMTHARISPDGKKITFTRYNPSKRGILPSDYAEENGSNYLNTEIVVADLSGSAHNRTLACTNQRDVEPWGEEIMNANSSWIDNDTIIYIHRGNLTSLPQLKLYHLADHRSEVVNTPSGLAAADPHCINGQLIFPVVPLSQDKNAACRLYTMKLDGTQVRQLPQGQIVSTSDLRAFKLGDYDPWLAADGKTAVFMRHFGGEDWRVFKIDLVKGEEKQLTATGITSGIPKWSPDGKEIIYVSWDKSKLENLGLNTMPATGGAYKKVPLPSGYLFTHPSYLPPGTSGAADANPNMIIFSARKVPGLPQ